MTRSGGRTGVTPNSGSDVVINIRANILQAQDSIKRMNNTLKGFQNDSQAAWARVQKGVAGSQVEYMRLRMGASRALKDIAVGKQEVFNQTQKLNTALGRSPFPAWALSIMFFGMALQRTFNRIWQSSTRAFQEVMGSVDGTVTQFTVLQGTTKWLGFVVGQALEPIAGWLIPIIERVASWVEQNEGLTRGLFIAGMAVGGLLLLLGFLVTSFVGLKAAVISTTNALAGLKLVQWSTGIAAITTSIKAATTASIAFLAVWGPVIGITAGIIGVGSIITSMIRQMGGFFEFVKSVLRGALRLISVVFSGLVAFVMELWNALKWVYNQIIQGLENAMNKATIIINKVVNGINRVFGTSIGNLNRINLSGAMAEVNKFGDSFIGTYSDMMNKYFEWENKVLSPDRGFMDGLKSPFNMGLDSISQSDRALMDSIMNNRFDIPRDGTPTSETNTIYNQNQVTVNLPSGITEQELDRILQKYLQTQ